MRSIKAGRSEWDSNEMCESPSAFAGMTTDDRAPCAKRFDYCGSGFCARGFVAQPPLMCEPVAFGEQLPGAGRLTPCWHAAVR